MRMLENGLAMLSITPVWVRYRSSGESADEISHIRVALIASPSTCFVLTAEVLRQGKMVDLQIPCVAFSDNQSFASILLGFPNQQRKYQADTLLYCYHRTTRQPSAVLYWWPASQPHCHNRLIYRSSWMQLGPLTSGTQ